MSTAATTTQNKILQFNRMFFYDKYETILDQCYEKCTTKSKPGSSLSGRENTCVENCQIKLLNAYAFLFNVVKDGGIARTSESQLKRLAL